MLKYVQKYIDASLQKALKFDFHQTAERPTHLNMDMQALMVCQYHLVRRCLSGVYMAMK